MAEDLRWPASIGVPDIWVTGCIAVLGSQYSGASLDFLFVNPGPCSRLEDV